MLSVDARWVDTFVYSTPMYPGPAPIGARPKPSQNSLSTRHRQPCGIREVLVLILAFYSVCKTCTYLPLSLSTLQTSFNHVVTIQIRFLHTYIHTCIWEYERILHGRKSMLCKYHLVTYVHVYIQM